MKQKQIIQAREFSNRPEDIFERFIIKLFTPIIVLFFIGAIKFELVKAVGLDWFRILTG